MEIKDKVIKFDDLKSKVEENNYEKLRDEFLKNFLEKVENYKSKQNVFFDEGFKLGLLVGEYQFYFEKLYDLEILDKELSEEEIEFIEFFRLKEVEYFKSFTSLKKHNSINLKKYK